MKKVIGLILASSLLCSTEVLAQRCNSASPNLGNIDDYYDSNKAVKFSRKSKEIFQRYINSMSGSWKGKLIRLDCVGSVKKPRKVYKKASVEPEIKSTGSGSFRVDYEANFPKESRTTVGKFKTLGAGGIYHFKFTGKNALMFTEKHRVSSGRGRTMFIETIYNVTKSNKLMKIEMIKYGNGYFISSEQWVLRRG